MDNYECLPRQWLNKSEEGCTNSKQMKSCCCEKERVRYGGRCNNDEEEDSILGLCCLTYLVSLQM